MLFIYLFAANFTFCDAVVLSTTVGQVRDHVVTSREVLLHMFVENALDGTKELKLPATLDVDSQNFAKEVSATLMDRALDAEARSFQAVPLETKELNAAYEKMLKKLKAAEDLKKYQYGDKELKDLLSIKLQAQKLVAFKVESSATPVSDAEARNYFEQNRGRFGNLPFENFRETIKSYLAKTQVETRVREWFEGLQSKYKIKNFSANI